MPSFCDHCTRQKKFCVISDKFNKCSECVCLKKLCLLFSDFLTVNIVWLLKTCEKIEKEQITFSDEKQHLFEAFQAAEAKKCWLCCHAQFLHNCDDKLIQENVKIFKKKLYVLKKKQNFIAFSDNIFSDLLISEINANIIFSVLSDNFWMNFNIEESFLTFIKFF